MPARVVFLYGNVWGHDCNYDVQGFSVTEPRQAGVKKVDFVDLSVNEFPTSYVVSAMMSY